MSDVAVQPGAGVYEPSLFGTYSKKIGMWLFLLSDSLTFGALLYAYTYGRVSTPNWPTPFHSESIRNATFMTAFLLTSSLTMVFAVRSAALKDAKAQRWWLLATMACGLGFVILHGREWTNLIAEGLTLPIFPVPPGHGVNPEFAEVTKTVPQFAATFFGLTGMHMLHVTLGVVYLGVIALRKWFIPILLGLWLCAWLGTPDYSPFHYGAHVLLVAAIIISIILWLKPKVYDASDVEVAGLYWHFVVSGLDVHFPLGLPDVNKDCVADDFCRTDYRGALLPMMDATQLTLEHEVAERHTHHPKSQFLWVWGALLVMTGIEVWLAYQNMELIRMLSILMALSLIKAALIIAYFMHMKFEVTAMRWVTMSSLVFCLAMMLVFLPDAFRILHLGVQ